MNISLFFRKKSAMTDWGLPFIRGAEEHEFTAKRNTTGLAKASAQLVRALVAAITGQVTEIRPVQVNGKPGVSLMARRHSKPSEKVQVWMSFAGAWGTPHAGSSYYVGLLAIAEAMATVTQAPYGEDEPVWDFWRAYADLLAAYQRHGLNEGIKPALLRAADELYYWLAYGGSHDTHIVQRYDAIALEDASSAFLEHSGKQFPHVALADVRELTRFLQEVSGGAITVASSTAKAEPAAGHSRFGDFVGLQGWLLAEAVRYGDNCLLAGPTGTGKTFLTELVALEGDYALVTINGMEGMIDLDIIGAILPQEDGSRKWVDGPLLRAMRMAKTDPVLLFVDEINRIPREQVNLFVGMMNPKSKEICEQQGLPVLGAGPFYVVEVPMTGEVVWCPVKHLRIVAAGNFGAQYAVYDLDPALRRRFDTVIEFQYPDMALEEVLLAEKTGLKKGPVTNALVQVAAETRRLYINGELPGCIDTASLVNWAHKCARTGAATAEAVMRQGRLVWADLVVGRDHTGRINEAALQALNDYLESLGILLVGGAA